jgi:site-specific recombinase XerC
LPEALFKEAEFSICLFLRNTLMLEFVDNNGIGLNHLLPLPCLAIDFEQCSAEIVGKEGKERLCPIGCCSIQAFNRFVEGMESAMAHDKSMIMSEIGENFMPRQVQNRLKFDLHHGDSPMDVRAHEPRHNSATHMPNGGADLRLVQEFLRHASLSTTKVDAHINSKVREAVDNRAHLYAEDEFQIRRQLFWLKTVAFSKKSGIELGDEGTILLRSRSILGGTNNVIQTRTDDVNDHCLSYFPKI